MRKIKYLKTSLQRKTTLMMKLRMILSKTQIRLKTFMRIKVRQKKGIHRSLKKMMKDKKSIWTILKVSSTTSSKVKATEASAANNLCNHSSALTTKPKA